jgi:hypothetical protein
MSNRKELEDILEAKILQAQPAVQSNPDTQKMVKQLRSLYQDNQEEFLFALGAGPPPAQTQPKPPNESQSKIADQSKVPQSRIPELLFLLNAVTSGESVSLPPSFKNQPGGMPSPLENSTLQIKQNPGGNIANQPIKPISPARRQSRIKELQEIETLDTAIHQAEEMLSLIKKDEEAIKQKKGKYAIAVERLKAERILREIPGSIEHLIFKKRLLEEQIEES